METYTLDTKFSTGEKHEPVETPILEPYSDEWMAWMFGAGTVGHRIAVRLRDELAAARQRIAEFEQIAINQDGRGISEV